LSAAFSKSDHTPAAASPRIVTVKDTSADQLTSASRERRDRARDTAPADIEQPVTFTAIAANSFLSLSLHAPAVFFCRLHRTELSSADRKAALEHAPSPTFSTTTAASSSDTSTVVFSGTLTLPDPLPAGPDPDPEL